MTLYEGMLTYPKDVPYRRYRQRDMDGDDSSNVSAFESTVHIGTHVDSPLHYYRDGYGCEAIPLDHLYGPAQVIDCRSIPAVTATDLHGKLIEGVPRVLLKTDNSQRYHDNPDAPFNRDFVYVDGTAAELFVAFDVKLVGIDYLSIDQSGVAGKPSHHTLLEKNITILEGIDLALIEPGVYFFSCGPLKMKGSDGAPARAVLIEGLL